MQRQASEADTFIDAIAERVAQKMRTELREMVSEMLQDNRLPETPLTPRQAARYAHRSNTTIYAALHAGELKFVSNGSRYLIYPEDLKEWMRRQG